VLPLGVGAIAGTTLCIDREVVHRLDVVANVSLLELGHRRRDVRQLDS
jgi:hypothetical protein